MALRLQISSDTHLEFYGGSIPNFDKVVEPVAPTLALLGDICTVSDESRRRLSTSLPVTAFCFFLTPKTQHTGCTKFL